MLYFKKARSGTASEVLEQGGGTQCRKERHSAAFLSPRALYFLRTVCYGITVHGLPTIFMAIPHNSKCRYGERGATAAKPKAQIILDAAKVSAASGGNSEPKQGQRSQSARGFCPRSTMQVPQPDIIEHFGNADAVPQLPERCLSRKAGIVRCCRSLFLQTQPDYALKSLGSRKGFPRLFALHPACVCEISVIFFVFRCTLDTFYYTSFTPKRKGGNR